jgi:hypothetical protein
MRNGETVRRRGSGERGAVAVEAALLIPLLAIIAFGMIETALLIRDHVSATTLARAGARVASQEPRFGTVAGHASLVGPSFAVDAADSMERAASTLPRNAIDHIYIYRADANGQPIGSCPGINCLFYRWNDLPAPNGRFVYQASNVPGAFNPASINACLGDPNAQSVGVLVQVDHPWLVGFFPGAGTKVTARTVMKFEPLLPDHTFAGVQPGCKP